MKGEMTSRERVRAAIEGQKTDRTPCALGLSYFVARYHHVPIAGIIDNPHLFLELKLQTFEELGGADLLNMAPPCLGNTPEQFVFMPVRVKMPGVDLPPDTLPQYDEKEIMLAEDYPLLIKKGWGKFVRDILIPRVFTPGERSSISHFDDSQCRRYLAGKDVAFLPSHPIMLPFEVLSFARSFEKFFIDLYQRPDMVKAALDVMMSEFLENVLNSIDERTDAVIIPANRESSGFISPRFFEEFAFSQLLTVVELMGERNITVYFHLDHDWTKILPYFRQFPEGRYVLHFDSMTDIFEAKILLGDRMCLMGDVPARLLRLGKPEDVEAYCRRLVEHIGRGGRFILGAG